MLKFVLLSVLCGVSLAMNVENTDEDLNLLARVAGCGKAGCTQTRRCQNPPKAEGFCTTGPEGCKPGFYKANHKQCKENCHCMMKCRITKKCSKHGGYCEVRGKACKANYTEKLCGCKTRNKCSCCIPNAKAHKLTC